MNKEAIIKTAVTSWSKEDDCFVTESPLADTIVGTGDTQEEAFQTFLDMVDMNYEAYLENKHALYDKPGRPKKHKKSVHIEIKPEVKEELAILARNFGISQGEAVEYLYFRYKAADSLQHAWASS